MKWLDRLRDRNKTPVDTPYTYVYTLGVLPLPQPWRKTNPEAYFLPHTFVLGFADKGRMSLLRNSEPEQIAALAQDMLTNGITTPLEMWIDADGKLRLQEGYHRMCVVDAHPGHFPRVPVVLRESTGKIKSYGRPVLSEVPFIFQQLGISA